MVSKLSQEFRKFMRNRNYLHRIFRDTNRSLDEISAITIFAGRDLKSEVITDEISEKLISILEYCPSLVILGQDFQSKAAFVNCLLGKTLLPYSENCWRWVHIVYGNRNHISLVVAQEFEVVESLKSHENQCATVSEDDLQRSSHEEEILPDHSAVLEVQMCHPLLRDNVKIIIPPDLDSFDSTAFQNLLSRGLNNTLPIFIYVFGEDFLTEQNVFELQELREMFPVEPVLFVRTSGDHPIPNMQELTESEQHQIQENFTTYYGGDEFMQRLHHDNIINRKPLALIHQLSAIGYINIKEGDGDDLSVISQQCYESFNMESCFLEDLHKLDEIVFFVRGRLQSHLVMSSSTLNNIHSQCLRMFILSVFDMAREIQITPRRIQYSQKKEAELYNSLVSVANEKQQEITHLIEVSLQDMRMSILEEAANYKFQGISTPEDEIVRSSQIVHIATAEIQHLVLKWLCRTVASELVKSLKCLQDTFVGTLQRCVESLEKNCLDQDKCLQATNAVQQILNAAYNVEVTGGTSSSFLYSFFERLRKLLHGFQMPWTSALHLDASWRKEVAAEMLDSLNAARLAKSICIQFRERVKSSHEIFLGALQFLENHYSGHLEKTEEERLAIRKYHAPRLARLALESTSMCDMVRYGIPSLGKELGRGQYGVVFSCDSWGGVGPCAVKSVVPPDEKHWNDLAMEFYYTRTIAEHKNVVKLRGSVIDHMYGGGCTPAVLLIMDRLIRDLYCGLQTGLEWLTRLNIAIDVVEGIRYLHSQGLVHRDIKLKNVLLDRDNQAKITDLGFCIPEAMMSGSIVGTPVHMAPELLSGHYDGSVDVYAFGILFWYICAGQVHLPYVFESYQNKEQLWTSVKKGIRPERLLCFDEKCWQLMKQCWSGDPSKRPLLGHVLPTLEEIRTEYLKRNEISHD